MSKFEPVLLCLALCFLFVLAACQPAPGEIQTAMAPTPMPPEYTLSSENVSQVPPQDVITEVVYFSIGGGTDDRDCSHDYEKPGLGYISKSTYTMQPILMVTCGWPAEKNIEAEVLQPDGNREQMEVQSDRRGRVVLKYMVPWDGQAGTYQFRLKRWFKSFEYSTEITHPPGPSVSLSIDRKQLYFFQFEPFEKVRVFLYDWTNYPLFAGWFEVEMNAEGNLVVDNTVESDERSFAYIAVGGESGQAVTNMPDNASVADMFCKGAPLPIKGIRKGSVVEVVSETLTASEFEREARIDLPRGTRLSIREGPTCRDQMYWWTGTIGDSFQPWYIFPEGSGKEYFIELIE